MDVLEEQDGDVVGMSWPLTSVYQIHTSVVSYHTPAVDRIEWA